MAGKKVYLTAKEQDLLHRALDILESDYQDNESGILEEIEKVREKLLAPAK